MDTTIININQISVGSDIVANVLTSTPQYKVIVLMIKQGATLKEHSSKTDACITICEGEGFFIASGERIHLHPGLHFSFKADLVHAIEAASDLKIILVK